MKQTNKMPKTKKSTIALHNIDEKVIIHRNGRGFFGHMHTWNAFFFSPSELAEETKKSYKPSISFAIFHIFRNPFLWHLLFPLTFLVLGIYFAASKYFTVSEVSYSSINDDDSSSAADQFLSSVLSVSIAEGPIWTSPGVGALFLLLSFLSATIIPRVVTPLFFSERGHRTDLRLPIDVVSNTPLMENQQQQAETPTFPQLAQHTFSFNDHHAPFRRIPITPKAIGFFAAIMIHPIVQFILLFTNAFPKSDSNADSLGGYPLSVFATLFTFDFVRYDGLSNLDVACAVGRFWYWFVVPLILLGFYGILIGIFWSPTNAQIEKEGADFQYFGQWSLGWGIALSLFPLFYRVLWSGGFSCYSSSKVWPYFAQKFNVTSENFGGNSSTPTISVASICPTALCDSSSQTAYIIFSFILLILTLPLLFNIHTQLRRLSGAPRQPWGSKVKPVPRLDGLHLYIFILNRFLLPAFSGLYGDIISICFVAFFLDLLMAFLIWRSPSVSNIESLNYWYRSWTVPGSMVSTLGFIFWTVLVYQNSEGATSTHLLSMFSILIQVITVVALFIVFISNFVSFKYQHREVFPSFWLATINYDLDSKLQTLAKSRYFFSRGRTTSPFIRDSNEAVGAAVQSSISVSGRKSKSNNNATRTASADDEQSFSPIAEEESKINDTDAASPTPSRDSAQASPDPRKNGDDNSDEDPNNEDDEEESEDDDEELDEIKYEKTAGQRVLQDEGRHLRLFKTKLEREAENEDHFSNISSEISFG